MTDFPRYQLKHVASINDSALGEGTPPDYLLRYVDIGNVNSLGRINEVTTFRFGNAPSRARRLVKDGDVIVSTVRTYLRAIAPIKKPPSNLVVSTGFAVVRPRSEWLDAGYCKYALRESSFIDDVVGRSVGVSYPAINSSELGGIHIPVPPIWQQQVIGEYLDRETGKIDALAESMQRLLTVLAEKRQAVIIHAVTRGLNPGAPLRDSGVAWIGEIPAHWNVELARWLFEEIDERSDMGAEELLTVSHLTGVTLRSEKDVNMFMAKSLEGYKVCRAGDLVINTLWAWMGAMGVAFQAGIVSPAYNVYRSTGKHDPKYIDHLVRMKIFAQEVTRYSKGVWSSRLRLYPEGFFEVELPVPPIEEQGAITAYLAKETGKIDVLHGQISKAIDLLKERRTSLISAAVTGQIQVTA